MAIKHMEMFKDLSNVELAKLLGKLEKLERKAGAVLFEQGDPGDRMYLIKSGTIELFSQKPDGARQSLAMLYAGDALGEMALLTNEPRSATAVMAVDSVLYEIDSETFDHLVTSQPQISSYFIRLLSQRLVSTNDRLQASKEAKAQWLKQELAQLPEPMRDFLFACACLRGMSEKLAAHAFQWTLQDGEDSEDGGHVPPVLERLVHRDEGFLCMREEFLRVMLDLMPQYYSGNQQQLWSEQAVSFYLAEGEWASAIEIYAEQGGWRHALDVAMTAEAALAESDPQRQAIGQALRRCPHEVLSARYEALQAYVGYCAAYEPEAGLSVIEAALDLQGAAYSAQQLITLYEQGAELCRKLGKKQLALKYLQLADTQQQGQGQGRSKSSEDRIYGLAKQMLARSKSEFLAESAGRLANRSRMLGIAAVVLAMLWVLGGVVEPQVALSGFATPTWLYMIFIMAMSAVITKSGFLYRFSLHALKRFPAHYRGQLWGIVAGGVMLNPMIPSSSAKVSLGVPIAQTLSESMGFKARSHGAAGLGLTAMLFYGFTAPFVLTGSYTNVMAYGLVSSASPVNWIQWFVYALPAFLIFSGVLLAVLFFMFRNTESAKPISGEVLDEQLRLLGPLSREERVAVFTVLGCITGLVLQPLHGVDSAWIMLIGFAVLVISGVLDRRTISTGIDWTFLLFLGVAFSFSTAANELGLVEALSAFLGGHMGGFISSPLFFLPAVIVLSFVVTLIVRDDPAVILLVTALLPLADQAGVHPWILVFVVLLSTDPFFFAYQSPTYLTAYYSSEGKAFSHRQGQKLALGYALAVILLAIMCIPYWRWLGLLN